MESIFFLTNEKKKIKVLSTINISDLIKNISKITDSFVIFYNDVFEKIYIFNDKSYLGSIDKIENNSIIIIRNKTNRNQSVFLDFKYKEINIFKPNRKINKINKYENSYRNKDKFLTYNHDDEEDNKEVSLSDENEILKNIFSEKIQENTTHNNMKTMKNMKNINTNTVVFFRKCTYILDEYLSNRINNTNSYLNKNKSEENIIYLLKKFCETISSDTKISLTFNFDETSKHLSLFHFKILCIIKKYFEYMISCNKLYKKYNLNINIKILKMNSSEIASSKIKNYVESLDNRFCLPKDAIIKLNKNKLSNNPKNSSSQDFPMLIFHEVLHCYGFGYWDLMGITNYRKQYNENLKNSIYSVDDIFYSYNVMKVYNNMFNCNNLIACPMEDGYHLSEKNRLILKNTKPYKVLPGINNELMCHNKNKYNSLSIISAVILESLGYDVNYSMIDSYYIDQLSTTCEINYTKITPSHYYFGYSKYMLILNNLDNLYTGNKTYSIEKGKTYILHNKQEWKIYVMKTLIDDVKYYCSEKEGVEYFNDRIIITPNDETPEIIYIVSSITFGGIPLIKKANNYNDAQSIHNLFKSLLDSF